MMTEIPPAAESEVRPEETAPLEPTEPPVAKPDRVQQIWNGFVSLFVVGGGVVLGTILAFIIALFLGWIPFC